MNTHLSLLKEHWPFNLLVSHFTLICDLAACILFIILPLIIFFSKKASDKFTAIQERDMLVFLLLAPTICIISHFGYILLAWITEPSKSTTTLLLYYFIISYLYLTVRLSYKVGCKLLPTEKYSADKRFADKRSADNQRTEQTSAGDQVQGSGEDPSQGSNRVSSQSGSQGTDDDQDINAHMFLINILLGVIYLELAVIFILAVYLLPLASEDVFSYLFNVLQFMIVVVSTQYVYKYFVEEKFKYKQVIEYMRKTEEYKENYAKKASDKDISHFLAEVLLLPLLQEKR